MKRLEGKVAVITGGNSGIGLASAKRLQEEGARVVIVGRSQKTLDEAAKALGNGVEVVGPMRHEFVRSEELVDRVPAFVGPVRRQKCVQLGSRGNPSGQIQINAAEKFFIGADRDRLGSRLFPAVGDLVVNEGRETGDVRSGRFVHRDH